MSSAADQANKFWVDLPETEAYQYVGASLVAFTCAFVIGITGVGGVAFMPGVVICLPNLNHVVAFGTTMVSLTPMGIAGVMAVWRHIKKRGKWCVVISISSMFFAILIQYLLSLIPEDNDSPFLLVIVIYTLFLTFFLFDSFVGQYSSFFIYFSGSEFLIFFFLFWFMFFFATFN